MNSESEWRRLSRICVLALVLFCGHDAPRPYADGYRPEAPSGIGPPARWTPFRTPGAVPYRDPQLRAHEDLYDAEVASLDRQVDRLLGHPSHRGRRAEAAPYIPRC